MINWFKKIVKKIYLYERSTIRKTQKTTRHKLKLTITCQHTQNGDRIIYLPIFNPVARKWWVASPPSPRSFYNRERNTVPFVHERWHNIIIQIQEKLHLNNSRRRKMRSLTLIIWKKSQYDAAVLWQKINATGITNISYKSQKQNRKFQKGLKY